MRDLFLSLNCLIVKFKISQSSIQRHKWIICPTNHNYIYLNRIIKIYICQVEFTNVFSFCQQLLLGYDHKMTLTQPYFDILAPNKTVYPLEYMTVDSCIIHTSISHHYAHYSIIVLIWPITIIYHNFH